MRDYRDAKLMAQTLRDNLKTKDVSLAVGESLELVARQFGYDNWNVLAAKIGAAGDAAGVAFQKIIPIIRIFDEAKALEFYVDWLGFEVQWKHRFDDNAPLYMEATRGDLALHLSEHHGDASPGSTVFVWMTGLDAFHRELLGKSYRYGRPGIEDGPGNFRTVQVHDPFGNRIRFSERKPAEAAA